MAISKAATRTRKSKAEVQEEFGKLETQVHSEKLEQDQKSLENQKIRESEIKEAVAEISAESIVQKLGNTSLEISKYLSEVSSRLITGASMLQNLRDAVTLEKRELERLHKIDLAKTAIDFLVEEYQQKKLILEDEAVKAKAQWEKEKELIEFEAKEFEELLKKNRAREREDYEYQKTLERKKRENEFEEAQRQSERKNKEKQEGLEKFWKERELKLSEKETRLETLEKENAEFPQRLAKEVERAVLEAVRSETAKREQEKILLQKEFETEKKLSDLRLKTLEDTVAKQYLQIESLSNRLDEAKNQVQDIAIKAIEGASGARALSHVNQIAMEQAKPRSSPPV